MKFSIAKGQKKKILKFKGENKTFGKVQGPKIYFVQKK